MVLEPSSEWSAASFSNFCAFLQVRNNLVSLFLGLHQDVARLVLRLWHGRDLRVVFGLEFSIRGLVVLEIVRHRGLFENLQSRQRQRRRRVTLLVEAFLLGLLRHRFGAHQCIEGLAALSGIELGRGLSSDRLAEQLELRAGERLAVNRGDRLGRGGAPVDWRAFLRAACHHHQRSNHG